MSDTDWAAVTGRVLVEACCPTPEDVVLYLGDDAVADLLRCRVGTFVRRDDLEVAPAGVSIVCLHGWLRRRPPAAQAEAIGAAAGLLPPRGLLIIGDAMWSFAPARIDAPEQYGDALEYVQQTSTIEKWAREAGFLPDLHRFAPGAAVLVAVRGLA